MMAKRFKVVVLLIAGIGPSLASGAEVPAAQDDVMRPTQRALRLTPDIARAISRNWLQDTVWRDMSLTPEQESRITEAAARRMMQVGHAQGKDVQPFIELFLERMMLTRGRFAKEYSKEFADQSGPFIKAVREYMSGVGEDARPILSPEQYQQLQAELEHQRRAVDTFEERMKAWSNGEFTDGDRPFAQLERDINAPRGGPGAATEAVRQARRGADQEILSQGTGGWKSYLTMCRFFFKFSDEQVAKGEGILKSYLQRAEEIMNPDWKERARQNRMRYNLANTLKDLPVRPLQYHLDREFRKMLVPIGELDAAYRAEVFGLATPEQRAAVLAAMRKTAAAHGISVEPDFESLVGLSPTTQSQGAP